MSIYNNREGGPRQPKKCSRRKFFEGIASGALLCAGREGASAGLRLAGTIASLAAAGVATSGCGGVGGGGAPPVCESSGQGNPLDAECARSVFPILETRREGLILSTSSVGDKEDKTKYADPENAAGAIENPTKPKLRGYWLKVDEEAEKRLFVRVVDWRKGMADRGRIYYDMNNALWLTRMPDPVSDEGGQRIDQLTSAAEAQKFYFEQAGMTDHAGKVKVVNVREDENQRLSQADIGLLVPHVQVLGEKIKNKELDASQIKKALEQDIQARIAWALKKNIITTDITAWNIAYQDEGRAFPMDCKEFRHLGKAGLDLDDILGQITESVTSIAINFHDQFFSENENPEDWVGEMVRDLAQGANGFVDDPVVSQYFNGLCSKAQEPIYDAIQYKVDNKNVVVRPIAFLPHPSLDAIDTRQIQKLAPPAGTHNISPNNVTVIDMHPDGTWTIDEGDLGYMQSRGKAARKTTGRTIPPAQAVSRALTIANFVEGVAAFFKERTTFTVRPVPSGEEYDPTKHAKNTVPLKDVWDQMVNMSNNILNKSDRPVSMMDKFEQDKERKKLEERYAGNTVIIDYIKSLYSMRNLPPVSISTTLDLQNVGTMGMGQDIASQLEHVHGLLPRPALGPDGMGGLKQQAAVTLYRFEKREGVAIEVATFYLREGGEGVLSMVPGPNIAPEIVNNFISPNDPGCNALLNSEACIKLFKTNQTVGQSGDIGFSPIVHYDRRSGLYLRQGPDCNP